VTDWSGEPAYRQVAEHIRDRIRGGEFTVDDQLPSIPSLMDEYTVSTTVVRGALAELRAQGVISTHQGKGVFVRKVPPAAASRIPAEVSKRLVDLESAVESLRQEFRRELGALQSQVLDLYARTGQPRPRQQNRTRRTANG